MDKTARDILNEAFADYKEAEDIGKMDKIFENTLKELRRLLPKKKKPVVFNINTPIKDYENNGWNHCLKAVREVLK